LDTVMIDIVSINFWYKSKLLRHMRIEQFWPILLQQ